MKRFVVMACFALLAAACARPAAETGEMAEHRARWAALADLPDWSGIWEIDWRNERGVPARPAMQLTPEYERRLAAFIAGQERGENLQTQAANCVPPGVPGVMTQPYPIEFLYQPHKVVLLTEAFMQFRHIYTDGRPLPEDPDPAYLGHSVGRWEGDTLVIESTGFSTDTLLAPGVGHSEQLRIIERIRRVSPEWLEIETTMIDPQVLAEPYTVTISYGHLDDELREYICLENNKSGADELGRPLMELE